MDKSNSDNRNSSKHCLKRKHTESDKKSKKHKKKHKKSKESTSSNNFGEKKKMHKKKKDKKSKTVKKDSTSEEEVADVPLDLMSKSMAPMTKEEWEKRQSIIRRVYDEESGRNRLIKGDGEVIEEIVSHKRHKEINKTATLGDGAYFQNKIISKIK